MYDIWTDALARLSSFLGLRPGEGRRTALSGAYHMGFVAGVVLLKSASNAMVVARYNAESLPPLYIASALVTGAVAWFAAHFDRGRSRKLPRRGLIGGSIALGALSIAVDSGLPWAITALYLFGEAFATLVSIRFWGGASELFDPRQSRRIFGILGGAGMAGAMIAGLLAQLLGEAIGAVGLLPLAMAVLLVSAFLGETLYRRVRFDSKAFHRRPPAAESPGKEARTYFLGSRHAQGMALLMLLLASLTAVADYVFKARAGAVLSEGQMASLFGALNFWMGALAVLFQVGVAGRILEKWGVFRYLSLTPTMTGAAAMGCLFLPGVGPAFALRLVESAGSLSLNPAAFQLLYGPVPDQVRAPIRSFIDGLVKKVGFALGGVVLLLVGRQTGETVLLLGLVGLVVVIALVLRRSKGFYLETIEKRLTRSVGRSTHLIRSAESRAVLRNTLDAEEPIRLLISLALLRDDPRFDPTPFMPKLIRHPDRRVRLMAIRFALQRRIAAVARKLEWLVEGDDPEIQYEAALALGKLAPARARDLLSPWLTRTDSPLSGAAIASLLPWEAGDGPATLALQARLATVDPPAELRIETVRALGKLGRSAYAREIESYLLDLDPSVRRAACVAAGDTQDPRLIETLCGLLTDRAVRTQARKALAAFGDQAVPSLRNLLDDRQLPLSLRLEIPRVLRAIGTEAAAHAMLFSNIQEHAYLRYRIALQLSRLHEEHPEVAVDGSRLRDATIRRLRSYEYYLSVFRDLEAALPEGSPLVRALDDRLQQNLEVIFRLLQIRFPDMPLNGAWHAFSAGGPRDRAYCLELLEHILDPRLRDILIPVLERYHRLPAPHDEKPADARRGPARVMELAVSEDQELAAISVHTALRTWPASPPLPPLEKEAEHLDAVIIERMFLFEGVETFSECDVDDLVALAQIVQEKFYRRGEAIYREGEEGGALYVVVEGKVICTRAGREVLQVGVKDSFGQSSLLDGGKRPVTAVAASAEVRVFAIQRDDFLALISDRPELLRGIFNAVTRHLREVLDGVGGMREEDRKILELQRSVG